MLVLSLVLFRTIEQVDCVHSNVPDTTTAVPDIDVAIDVTKIEHALPEHVVDPANNTLPVRLKIDIKPPVTLVVHVLAKVKLLVTSASIVCVVI